jgi:predicted site-specific integrase-resolvase
MKRMVIDPDTKKRLVTPKEAATIYGCSYSNLRMLRLAGEIRAKVESPRRLHYYLDDIERVSREKAKLRKQRGGRPRKTEK